MSKNRRVVVTGLGAVTPLGNTVRDTWEGMKAGRNGITPITLFDTEKFKAKLGAQVKAFDPKTYPEVNDILCTDRYAQFSVAAAQQAVEESGIVGTVEPERFSVYFCTGISGIGTFENEHSKLLEKGPRRVSALFIPMMISNMAAGMIALPYDCRGSTQAMREAMREAAYTDADIVYINAHGTGTPLNDRLETIAIKAAMGTAARRAYVSSTKSMTGHMLGAAGAVEALACICALNENILPPTIDLMEPDEACNLNYVPNRAVRAEITLALSNSLGFGGHNACLADFMNETEIRKYTKLMIKLGLTGLEITEDNKVVRLERESSVPIRETVNTEKISSDESVDYISITSPIVGVFYAAPAEDADPFVTVSGRVKKGQTLCNVEAMKLMKQAEKFGRPIICFIDTSGAFCGIGAEERGQGQTIAENLMEMSGLCVPILSVLVGEGGSGGGTIEADG